jgi:LEA14-like dessication related protein
LYLILGIAALYYLPTLISLLKLDISIVQVIPIDIQSDLIKFNVSLRFINKNANRIIINNLSARVLFNGVFIGTIEQLVNSQISAGGQQTIGTLVVLEKNIIGAQLWTQLINSNLQNGVVDINGTIKANSRPYPFFTSWTIKDFIT